MPERERKYGYSVDGGEYFFLAGTSRQSALELAGADEDLEPPFRVHTAELVPVAVTSLLPPFSMLAEHVIDLLAERAAEDHGKSAEGWPEVTGQEAEPIGRAVHAAVESWFAEHPEAAPSFFGVAAVCVQWYPGSLATVGDVVFGRLFHAGAEAEQRWNRVVSIIGHTTVPLPSDTRSDLIETDALVFGDGTIMRVSAVEKIERLENEAREDAGLPAPKETA